MLMALTVGSREERSIKIKPTERAADGSDNIAMVYLHFLTTAAGFSPTEAPISTSSSHYKKQNS